MESTLLVPPGPYLGPFLIGTVVSAMSVHALARRSRLLMLRVLASLVCSVFSVTPFLGSQASCGPGEVGWKNVW
jgi:ABC-type amino acid transport system permease subunit